MLSHLAGNIFPLTVAGLAIPCLLSSTLCPVQWIPQNSSCNLHFSCLSSGLSLLPCPSLAWAGIFLETA